MTQPFVEIDPTTVAQAGAQITVDADTALHIGVAACDSHAPGSLDVHRTPRASSANPDITGALLINREPGFDRQAWAGVFMGRTYD